MSEKAIFRLVHDVSRRLAVEAVTKAEQGSVVTVGPATRGLDQSARFHAMLQDIVRAGVTWDGSTHDIEFWKSLVVSGWAIATKAQGEVTRGIEGEIVLIRRSTTTMTKSEMTSLIDYLSAFLDTRGIPRREP